MSIATLQDLLDASMAAASPFTRSLEGEMRTAREVEEFINATRNVTIAVVRRTGLPHAAPVIGGCVEGNIYATVSPGSVLANCLGRSPEVAFTVAGLVNTLIGAGTAENVGPPSQCSELCNRLDRASPFGKFAPEGWNGLVYRLRPRRLFAW
jgi:nitroimidazol reductase NimA-like FMN-containing flavoprotein (pyridoxamine 5'-phosphate oxidase superfamily)